MTGTNANGADLFTQNTKGPFKWGPGPQCGSGRVLCGGRATSRLREGDSFSLFTLHTDCLLKRKRPASLLLLYEHRHIHRIMLLKLPPQFPLSKSQLLLPCPNLPNHYLLYGKLCKSLLAFVLFHNLTNNTKRLHNVPEKITLIIIMHQMKD